MFNYYNPSKIIFETGILKNKNKLREVIGDGDYCIFTYSDKVFQEYSNQIINALGEPKLIINNILPNPDYKNLREISESFRLKCSKIKFAIALGGGSVIDTAKFIVLGKGNFDKTIEYVEKKVSYFPSTDIDLISIPTTA